MVKFQCKGRTLLAYYHIQDVIKWCNHMLEFKSIHDTKQSQQEIKIIKII